jgi:hypothetical protein
MTDGISLQSFPHPFAVLCRSDGRCQYAIDSGAEGMGHCPQGKCIMPKEVLTAGEFTVTRYHEGDYWVSNADGEGMQVRKERMETLIKELWKEF